MKSHVLCFLTLMSVTACQSASLNRVVASERQPYVVSVTPESGAEVDGIEQINLIFSRELLPQTVSTETIFILTREAYAVYENEPWTALSNDVQDGSVTTIPGEVLLSADALEVRLQPLDSLSPAKEYVVIALPIITTTDHYPLNQTVIGNSSSHFESSFVLRSGSLSQSDSEVSGTSEDATGSSSDTENSLAFDFSQILITEIATDPAFDHGESEDGNGTPFDMSPGSGSVGSTDEYIELYNGTSDDIDLSSWTVVMRDGTDVSQALSATEWVMFFSAGGGIASFQSGETLVLGNPQGDMKNEVQVELYDGEGDLRQFVSTSTKSKSQESESYRLSSEGVWEWGEGSPGEVEFESESVVQNQTAANDSVANSEAESEAVGEGETITSSGPESEEIATTTEFDESNTFEDSADTDMVSTENARVLITEVVTDPQQDHGESAAGNGVPFDSIPGSGTIGTTDEYVEIYNASGESIDLRDWTLTMIDGTDVTQTLSDEAADLFFSDGGSLDAFLDGETLVFGNPSGDMKNTLQLELRDTDGNIMDQVSIPDANASGINDESYQLNESGDWEQGIASPGQF